MTIMEAREILLKVPNLTYIERVAVKTVVAMIDRKNLEKINNSCYSLDFNDLPGEEWRDVIGYEGLYQVSNYGRVKSFHNNGVRTLNPSFADYPGYYVVNLTKNGKQQTQYVHILVAQAFIPNPENKSYVNHIDGDKLNNCLENLEWTTPTENSRHAWRNGLIKSRTGTKNLHSKLTPEQVRYIRVSYKPHDENFSIVALARKFNVSKSTIYLVLARKTYKDVV